MARTKQNKRKCNKDNQASRKQGSKTTAGERSQRKINCTKFFNKFKFERKQTNEPLHPRAAITRCFSPFLRTTGQSDMIIGLDLYAYPIIFFHTNCEKYI